MSLIRNVPLSPVVTGSLLYALTRAPEQYRVPLLQKIQEHLSSKTIARAITTLKWLFGLGIARTVHNWLSTIAENNFRLRSEAHRYDWPNEIAVVTGAASGFGALMAKGLAAKGVNVMAIDIKAELPSDMKSNGKIHYYKCDITKREDVMNLAEQIRKEHGDPSVLINNAGVGFSHSVLDVTEYGLNKTFEVNILSHYWTIQAFLPAMIKDKKGHIVATASMASFLTAAGMLPYAGTKAAVLSMHEGLKAETRILHKAPEIKFSVVHPTFADTPMVRPIRDELKANKVTILDPNIIANAVVDQIISGRGRQIILGAEIGWLNGIRAWPHWLAQALIMSQDGVVDIAQLGEERTWRVEVES